MPDSYGFVESQSGYSGSTIAMRGITLNKIDKKIYNGKDLDETEKAFLINKVNDLWDYHPDTLFRFPRWRKFIAWVAGYQYYTYEKTTRELQPIPIPTRRKLVFNRLRSFVRMMLAKLTANGPNIAVVPNTDDYEDQAAAELGDVVLDFLTDKVVFDDIQRTFKMWYILCNRAYLHVFWNEQESGVVGSHKVDIKNSKQEVTGHTWETITEDGDLGMEAVPPFNCRADPLNFHRKNWRWFIYGVEVDAEDLEDQYELEEGILRDVTDTKTENVYILETTGDKDFSIGTPVKQEAIVGRVVTKKEYWTKNMYAIIAGTTLLDYGPNNDDAACGEIPFFCYEERLVPIDHYEKGLIYNDPVLKDMIPIQREYNRHKSNISNLIERAAKLRVLMPFTAGVNKTHWIEEAGTTFIDYNPSGGKPEQIQMNTMPPYLPQFAEDLEREFESVGNIHEASFGRLPERASHASGVLVNLLVEQDDVVFDPIIKEMDAVFADAWTLGLKLVQTRYTISRILKVAGKGYAAGAVKFQGAELRGNTTVRINSNVGLPKSRALRVEYLLKLQQQQLLTDPKEVLELLEFGNARKVFADVLLDQKKAERENQEISNSPNIDPNSTPGWIYKFEDSAAHLQVHRRDRLSPKWETYTKNQQMALDNHILATAQVVAQNAQAAAQATQQPNPAANAAQAGPQSPMPPTAAAPAPPGGAPPVA